MSNLLFMDESNGNGVFASKSNNPSAPTTNPIPSNNAATTTSNFNSIINATMNSTVAAAAMAVLPTSVSSEDLSQSLSEYTDADESISAPTEFLAEFLSAVMLKDYKKALKYCKLILQYEPNNATAKEFYPLILEKLAAASSDSDENYNKSSSPEMILELQSSDPSGESDGAASDDQMMGGNEDAIDEFGNGISEDNYSGSASGDSNPSSSCGLGGGDSLSESLDDVDEDNDCDDDVDDDVDDVGMDEEEEDDMSSSADDSPLEDQPGEDGLSAGAGNASRNSSSGGEGRSRSDNTTHSYSSLLLEEEDDIVAVNLQFPKDSAVTDLDVSNGNKVPSASCSDSESPTEPLTQRLAAILLSKCGVSSAEERY